MTDPRANTYPLRRRDLARRIMADSPDALYIAGLGATAWDLTSVEDRHTTFPLWGAMGGAAAMGLGLALAQPARRVIVVTGDGEQLMGMGALATIALQRPKNLAIAVFDNESYGETGMQATHTASGVDLCGIARAAGLPVVASAADEQEAEALYPLIAREDGPVFVSFKIRAEALDFSLPPKDGAWLKDRFRHAVLGPAGIGES